MKRLKKQVYEVQCANDPAHVFPKIITTQEGTEDTETEVQAYCPFCDEMVTFTVQGELEVDEEFLRKFKL